MVANRLAGDIGLCISVTLWTITLWRVVIHLLPCKEASSWERLTKRRVFHALLWVSMSLECVAYADVAGLVPLSPDQAFATKLGYVLLEVVGRSMFEFLAFSVVTILWFETARHVPSTTVIGSRTAILDSLPHVLLGAGILLAVCSAWEAVDMFTSLNETVFRGHILVESLSWFIHAVAATVCTILTAKRILRLSTFPQSDTCTRTAVLVKPLVPMALCGICYAVRATWLFCLFVTMPHPTNLADRYGAAWWVGFIWVPTLVPSIMLLYSARKVDPVLQENDDLVNPLLPTPVPPAEAFISFRRFRENHDLFSPLGNSVDDPRAQDADLFEPLGGEIRQLKYDEADEGSG